MKSILIKDTTKEEREQIIKESLDCGGGCENCSSCWLGGGSPFELYQPYIDGEKEIAEINREYNARYQRGNRKAAGMLIDTERIKIWKNVITAKVQITRKKCTVRS